MFSAEVFTAAFMVEYVIFVVLEVVVVVVVGTAVGGDGGIGLCLCEGGGRQGRSWI